MYGWIDDIRDIVPAHDSDAWLAGIIRALHGAGTATGITRAIRPTGLGESIIILGIDKVAMAHTLHAALCRAVLPKGEHTC